MVLPILSESSLIRHFGYIDGSWIDCERRFPVIDPTDESVLGEIADCGVHETEQAIEAAVRALTLWRDALAKDRGEILSEWRRLILLHQKDLARIISAEGGKPYGEALSEVAYGASFVEWFAEEGKRVYGDIIPSTRDGRRILVLKESIGVVAAITPWNFPNAMVLRKCAPALAAGCAVVIKPAEETPFSALALAVLAERAGLPPGVLNVLPALDPIPIAQTLTQSPEVRKLSFTGSTEVGKQLMRQSASTLKKLSLELGGNAPFIVFEDADLDAAVQGAMASKFRNSGQTCVCANRFLVQDTVYDEFSSRFMQAVSALTIGSPAEPGVTQGPLINQAAVAKVETLIQDALAQGATLSLGGERHPYGPLFFQPTLLTDVTQQMRIAQEEIFGPVASLIRFSSQEQAINIANDTEYGLACYLFSRNLSRVWDCLERLQYGMIAVNDGLLSSEAAPFGGIKHSGFGREGSKYGLDEFVTLKYVCLNTTE